LKAAAFVVLAGLALGSCGKRESPGPVRIGLVPAENLSGDASLDWISPAVPVLLAAQLEGLPNVTVARAASRRELTAGGATPVLCRYEAAPPRLRIVCWRDGAASPVRAEAALDAGLAAIVSRIGQGLAGGAGPAPEVSDRALRAYAAKDFLEAARLAPDFGYAYTDGAAAALLAGERATADRLIADGLARGSGIGEIARARLHLLGATASQHRGDQIAALRRLTQLIPGEPDYWQRLAQLLSVERQFAEAAEAQDRLASLRPGDAGAWNQLAYLWAWSGDTARAEAAVARYERLEPGSANAADTLGDVYFHGGKFAEAEKRYLESMARDENFLAGQGYFKAAVARLRLADAGKADEHFLRFAEKAGPAKELLLAQWRYVTAGAATADLERLSKAPAPDVSALALAQLALFRRLAGEGDAANQLAQKSLTLARSPLARRAAQTAFFVTLPKTNAAAWRDRAEQALPGPELEPARRRLMVEALIAQGAFDEAVPLARKLFDEAAAGDDYAPRLYLAWCLYQTGDRVRPAELLRANPVPAPPTGHPFEAVLLRQELELRRALGLS
jgi:hypothetical protein